MHKSKSTYGGALLLSELRIANESRAILNDHLKEAQAIEASGNSDWVKDGCNLANDKLRDDEFRRLDESAELELELLQAYFYA